jgi:glutathionylspermidine synthase
MIRISIDPRPDWKAKVAELEFDWAHVPTAEDPVGLYWDERAYWHFTTAEIDHLEAVTEDLHAMCLSAAESVITRGLLPYFGFTPEMARVIENSWTRRHQDQPSLYGRFDLAFAGAGRGDGQPKLLEYNADTPTGLYEASVVQWAWLEDRFPEHDQFNSIHEGLVAAWAKIGQQLKTMRAGDAVHFTCMMPHSEDEGTLRYILETGLEAGLRTKLLNAADIGWTTPVNVDAASLDGIFVDLEDQEITTLFKILPWDWLLTDRFSTQLAHCVTNRRLTVIEPAWKAIISNKAILAVLWELYPNHPNLLPAFMDRRAFAPGAQVVAKPLLGREGANISIATLGEDGTIVGAPLESSGGIYGDEGYVYQALTPLAEGTDKDGATHRAVIGSWVIDGQARGLGIREDKSLITHNRSRFVPHLFGDEAGH